MCLFYSFLFQNSSQACKCLQTLSKNGNYKQWNQRLTPYPEQRPLVIIFCVALIQEQLMELDCVSPLKALLKTSSPESALTLLSALSAHPPNNVRFPRDDVNHLLCVTAVKQRNVSVDALGYSFSFSWAHYYRHLKRLTGSNYSV